MNRTLGRTRAGSFTSPVELMVHPQDLPPPPASARRIARTGPHPVLPAMQDLTKIARRLALEPTLADAVTRLQHEACRLLDVTDALCVWLDWPRGTATTLTGAVSDQIHELVRGVAGSGRRSIIGSTLIEPLGPPPARAVLALRRPSASTFLPAELAMISAFAAGIAPTIDRLIAAGR